MAKVELEAVPEHHRRLVQNVLNAGMTVSAVQRHDRGGAARAGGLLARAMGRPIAALEKTYLVHTDLFKTLLLYRAGSSALSAANNGQLPPYKLGSGMAAVESEQRKLLVNGRGGNGAPRASHEEIRQRLREELLRALGLPSEALEEHEVASEAREAAEELKRQLRAHRDLRIVLEGVEQNSRRTLDEATLALKREFAEDKRALDLLSDTRREVSQMVLALMLHPERNLFDDLIREAEKGGDDDLLKRLHTLRDHIERMNPANGSDWRYIAGQIRRLGGGTPISTH
jgi:hypothetical protein